MSNNLINTYFFEIFDSYSKEFNKFSNFNKKESLKREIYWLFELKIINYKIYHINEFL